MITGIMITWSLLGLIALMVVLIDNTKAMYWNIKTIIGFFLSGPIGWLVGICIGLADLIKYLIYGR